MSQTVPTRMLVMSDTHGAAQLPVEINEPVDVAIHCGDLTEESKLSEFRTTIELLKNINAPLKLVIAGNHDWTLDDPMFLTKLKEAKLDPEDEAVRREYGSLGSVRALLLSEGTKRAGIRFLNEGTHEFNLQNGAKLTVYASPYTPSVNDWGFQYDPKEGEHDWRIDGEVDVAITHGPPHGILDYTAERHRAGSPGLFAAIARSQPQLHCFGHIHSAWGAKAVTWRAEISEKPSHFADIDNEKSAVISSLTMLRPHKLDSEDERARKAQICKVNYQRGYCSATADHSGTNNTLFVNAALENHDDDEVTKQLPWVINLDLPTAHNASSKRKRADDSSLTDEITLKKMRTTPEENSE